MYGSRFSREVLVYRNVRNGEEGKDRQQAPAYLLSGPYAIRLTGAGNKQTAFGPDPIGNLSSGKFYSIFAIGELGRPSFRLVVQTIDGLELETFVRGTACGGKIALSTTDVRFGQSFDVELAGGRSNGSGFLHIGTSDSRLASIKLPLDLSPLGATGCTLYQNTQVILPVSIDARGNALVPITIPPQLRPTLDEIHFQYSFLAGGANAPKLQLTEYASVEKTNN